MEPKPICEFCDKSFSSEGSLKTHLSTAKYCISTRQTKKIKSNVQKEKTKTADTTITKFECEYCNKMFMRKQHLQVHITTCKNAFIIIKNQQIIDQMTIERQQIIDQMTIERQQLIDQMNNEHQQVLNILSVEKCKTDAEYERLIKMYSKNFEDLKQKMYNLTQHTTLLTRELNIKLDETEQKLERKRTKINNLESSLEKYKESNQTTMIELAHNKGQIVGIKTAPPVSTSTSTQTINAKEVNIKNKLANVPTNIRPLTVEYIREEQDNYSYEMFLLGADGLAKFFEPLMICYDENDPDAEPSRNYVCTDAARNKYHNLMGSKKWQHDDGITVLGNWLNGLDNKSDDHWDQYNDDAENLPIEIERHNLAMKRCTVLATFNGIKISHGVERAKLVSDIRAKLKNKICI